MDLIAALLAVGCASISVMCAYGFRRSQASPTVRPAWRLYFLWMAVGFAISTVLLVASAATSNSSILALVGLCVVITTVSGMALQWKLVLSRR